MTKKCKKCKVPLEGFLYRLPKKLRVLLRTFGCQMNVRDSEVIAGLLKQEGYCLVDEPDGADIIIFNTCSVRQHAEDKVWSEIGNILKSRRIKDKGQRMKSERTPHPAPRSPLIGLVGCMAQNYKEAIFERSSDVDFVVGPSDIAKIPEIIESLSPGHLPAGRQSLFKGLYDRKIWETDGELRPEEIYHTGFYADKEQGYVVISEGCSNFCSYCVVPYVRGALHNRNYKDILKEIEQAIDKGISKITLLGQNVNAYNSQGQPEVNFISLLKMINSIKGLEEFSFITSHPRDTAVELFRVMAGCDKLKKYLHLPVQSGSDKILEKMNRGYTRKFYLDLVDNYRKIVKGGLIGTDIIVGFSAETEKDFQDTHDLVKAVEFNSAYIFKYSPRPHSAAFNWMDDVSIQEKERRHQLILELQKKISKRKNAK